MMRTYDVQPVNGESVRLMVDGGHATAAAAWVDFELVEAQDNHEEESALIDKLSGVLLKVTELPPNPCHRGIAGTAHTFVLRKKLEARVL